MIIRSLSSGGNRRRCRRDTALRRDFDFEPTGLISNFGMSSYDLHVVMHLKASALADRTLMMQAAGRNDGWLA